MAERRLLITGATGFIGSEVLARLLKKIPVERVTLLGRRKPNFKEGLFFERMREHGLKLDPISLQAVETNFLDSAKFRRDLEALGKDPWTIVHLAALIHGKGDRAVQERVNIGVTRDLLDWLNVRGGHFVFTSSVVAFGGTREPIIRSERDFRNFPPESTRFDYFRTKREAHLAVVEHAKVPVTILCPGVVHGTLENYKDSRGHLKALRAGRLSMAPSGGGNIVSLDHVAGSIVAAALEVQPQELTTKLLVGRNLTYAEYFSMYVRIARGPGGQKITRLPAFLGAVGSLVFRIFSAFGFYSSLLDNIAQGSLYLHFRSEHEQVYGPPIEDAIRSSIPRGQAASVEARS